MQVKKIIWKKFFFCQVLYQDLGGVLLRVAVITQGTSKVLDSILESEHEVVGIIESSPVYELNPYLKAAG